MSPAMLIDSLHGVRRRLRVLALLMGTGWVLLCLFLMLIALVALDYLLHLPAWPRISLAVGAIGCAAWAAHAWIVRPIIGRLELPSIAARVEVVFPSLADRLRSTLDFLRNHVPGSQVMKERTIAETARLAEGADFRAVLSVRPVFRSLALATIAMMLVVAGALAWPRYAGLALDRLVHPFSAPQWPKDVRIDRVEGMPQRGIVQAGQRLELRLRVARGDKPALKAMVHAQYDDGPVSRQLMSRGSDGMLGASVETRGTRMKLWISAGDDSTAPAVLRVVPPLAVRSAEAIVTPPPYTHLQPGRSDLAHGATTATEGSRVAVRASFNRELAGDDAAVWMEAIGEKPMPQVNWTRPARDSAEATWAASRPAHFRIRGRDIDGFYSAGGEEYAVLVRADSLPTVTIEEPRRNEQRTAAGYLPLSVLADDDYGIAEMNLVVRPVGSGGTRPSEVRIPLRNWETEVRAPFRIAAKLAWAWDLPAMAKAYGLELKTGDMFDFSIAVRDNYEVDGRRHDEVESGRLRLTIISEQQLLISAMDTLRSVYEQVRSIREMQERTIAETNLVREQLARGAAASDVRATIARLGQQEATLAGRTQQAAGALAKVEQSMIQNRVAGGDIRQTASAVRDMLRQIADDPMARAAQQLADARQSAEAGHSGASGEGQPTTRADGAGGSQSGAAENSGRSQGGSEGKSNSRPSGSGSKGSASDPSRTGAKSNDGGKSQEGPASKSGSDGAGGSESKGGASKSSGGDAKSTGGDGKSDAGSTGSSSKGNTSGPKGSESSSKGSGGKSTGGSGDASGSAGKGGSDSKGASASGQSGSPANGQSPPGGDPSTSPLAGAISRSAGQQSRAARELAAAQDRLGAFDVLEQLRREIELSLEEQRQLSKLLSDFLRDHLGAGPDDLTESDRDKLRDLAAQQKGEADRTEALTGRLKAASQQVGKSDPSAAQALGAAGQSSSKRGVPSNQRTAAGLIDEARGGSARVHQKLAEEGLEDMLRILQDADRRRIEQLVQQLAELREKVAILIRRQAGHNLDDLLLTQQSAGEKPAAALLAELAAKANRDKPLDAPTELSTLIRLQEQTQRNTQSAAGDAQRIRDYGPRIAARLARAGDSMETAAGELRDGALAKAYSPPQVEALASLEQAMADLIEAQRKAQAQLDLIDEGTVRARLQKIHKDEAALLAEVARIEKTRGEAGLGRVEMRNAVTAGDRQAAIAAELARLAEPLAKSRVYIWTLRDVGEAMARVKESLSQADTGRATQVQIEQIIAQLDSMIRNLMIKREPKKYVDPPTPPQPPGDPPDDWPPVPTEAELRLLRDLQMSLNNATKAISELPKADAQRLQELGQRQARLRDLLRALFARRSRAYQ